MQGEMNWAIRKLIAQVSKIIITMILTFAATAETLVEFCMKMLCVIVYTAAVVADDWMIA